MVEDSASFIVPSNCRTNSRILARWTRRPTKKDMNPNAPSAITLLKNRMGDETSCASIIGGKRIRNLPASSLRGSNVLEALVVWWAVWMSVQLGHLIVGEKSSLTMSAVSSSCEHTAASAWRRAPFRSS